MSESQSAGMPSSVAARLGRFAPAGSALLALLTAFLIADVAHPTMVFAKYLAAAQAPASESAARLLDYSPLYLALVRLLLPWGASAILAVQGVLFAGAAAAAAWLAGRLAGGAWGWLAGAAVAFDRPLLVYTAVHEPELVIVAALALALVAVQAVRETLRRDSRVSLRTASWLALATLGLCAAGLSRPQYFLLVPVWLLWLVLAVENGRRRAVLVQAAAVAAAVGLIVVGPPLWSRTRASGAPIIMNPGPVFYEGNGPGATGLVRFAPAAVLALEAGGPGRIDYAHVAYRRIASFVTREPLGPTAANRYWVGLAFESVAARPAAALRRAGRKLLMAVMPYEAHDLVPAERIDRALRGRLPLGCCASLAALGWLALARRQRWATLLPLASILVMTTAVQVFAYASSRQRLPTGFVLWVLTAVLAADLVANRLRPGVRPGLALLVGIAAPCALVAATARVAVLDQVGWDRAVEGVQASPGASLVALQEGRLLRPELDDSARRFDAAVSASNQGQPVAALALLQPLLGRGLDFTIEEVIVGVPEYWAGRDLLALGQREAATAALDTAAAIRPDDPRVLALAERLHGRGPLDLAGCDPVSGRLVQATAAAMDHDPASALALVGPLLAAFPELLRRGPAVRPPESRGVGISPR